MMPRNATHLFAFLILLSSSLTAQLGSPVRATSVEGPISIDGRLDDPAWSQAVSFDAPIEVDPRENTPALQRTDIRIVYTQDMLYVAFVCHDSSIADLRSHISDRDRLYADDYVILIIDTYGDAQKAFEFFVNPVNVQGDALRAGENEDDSYEMVWQSAASIHDSLWIVELGIPFNPDFNGAEQDGLGYYQLTHTAGRLLGLDPAGVAGALVVDVLGDTLRHVGAGAAWRHALKAVVGSPERTAHGDLVHAATGRVLHWASAPARDRIGVTAV